MPRSSIGAIAIALALLAGCAGQATPRSSGPPADVAGIWHGTYYNPSGLITSSTIRLVLEQTGNKVTGRAEPGGDLEGSVDGNSFSYRYTSLRGGGDLTVNGDEMKGFGSATGVQLAFKRQR
jgi:hypothetical protein